MITKIKSIDRMAVFHRFVWDSSVKARNGKTVQFKKVNILYGRNYSGKTTLSRLVRAFETGYISEKFESPKFDIELSDGSVVTETNLSSHSLCVRVFNDDFVREHLRFIFNPSEDIESFAILGRDNNEIEKEIEQLISKLGSREEGLETGLYKRLKDSEEELNSEKNRYTDIQNALESKVKNKALDRNAGIKYKSERFGDQNYTSRKLFIELEVVAEDSYSVPSIEELTQTERVLSETTKEKLASFSFPTINFKKISESARELVERKITESERIEELIREAVLNRWVNAGRALHKDKRDKCAFCGNPITADRWSKLEKHFDKESEELKDEIEDLLIRIDEEKQSIATGLSLEISDFYSAFHHRLNTLSTQYEEACGKYIENLAGIASQLKQRLDQILSPVVFEVYNDTSHEIEVVFNELISIREESNDYSTQLSTKQANAQEKLRLKEVFDFGVTIGYSSEKAGLEQIKTLISQKEQKRNEVALEIHDLEIQLEDASSRLNDEEEGARKVNEYLNDYFGHQFLSLKAVETPISEEGDIKAIRFEIMRDGSKAHHLSEGECSLISFCYFVAKLEDTKTRGQKPIIWIDDPISSLDNNHIFFLFSIIKSKIVDTNSFEQLFISTHSLEFLKYLKRLGGGTVSLTNKFKSFERSYFLIERQDRSTSLQVMPKYLKEYVTEFNYLFKQIYDCATISQITDKNYITFYNFGNNARKFLEIYLYYRYPDATTESQKLERFFEDKPVPAILTERMNNEYSHLAASFERGATPVEAPEMQSAARMIIETVKSNDKDQYDALLNSLA